MSESAERCVDASGNCEDLVPNLESKDVDPQPDDPKVSDKSSIEEGEFLEDEYTQDVASRESERSSRHSRKASRSQADNRRLSSKATKEDSRYGYGKSKHSTHSKYARKEYSDTKSYKDSGKSSSGKSFRSYRSPPEKYRRGYDKYEREPRYDSHPDRSGVPKDHKTDERFRTRENHCRSSKRRHSSGSPPRSSRDPHKEYQRKSHKSDRAKSAERILASVPESLKLKWMKRSNDSSFKEIQDKMKDLHTEEEKLNSLIGKLKFEICVTDLDIDKYNDEFELQDSKIKELEAALNSAT